MKKEIKTAVISAIVIAAAIGGIMAFLSTLDNSVQAKQLQNIKGSPVVQITTQNKSFASYPDEANYPLAPQLTGISGYINTSPEDLKTKLKDKVVLYDFWTYSCINCIRTFPFIKAWNEKYSDKGLVIVGIHAPEFEFEKDINNVKMAAQKYGLTYSIVLDNDHSTWDAFSNRYWPAEYIADDLGHIRHVHFGEGEYDQTEKVIQQLLDMRAKRLGLNATADQGVVNVQAHEFSFTQTPELYFGHDFANGRDFLGNSEGFQPEKTVNYVAPADLQKDHFYLDGQWQNLHDSMKLVSDNGKIILPYTAQDVHIVASGNGGQIQVLLDGKAVSQDDAGQDLKDGMATISENRLYNLISSKQAGHHIVTIIGHPGFEIYTFTFG